MGCHHFRGSRFNLVLFLAVAIAIGNLRLSSTALTRTASDEEWAFSPKANLNCLSYNSEEWLSRPRFQNLNETLDNNSSFLAQMTIDLPIILLDPLLYLQQSLAHEHSRFLDVNESQINPKSIRRWSVRLMYLATLYHQHKPAIREAQQRLNNNNQNLCQPLLQRHQVGNWDYECPDTKYIVGGLTNNGLGSNIRAATTTVLMAALISNRTAILIQNTSADVPKFLQKPWKLASCPRQDFQCFFLPTSPCVPTWKDIEQGYVLEGDFDFHFATEGKFHIPAKQLDNKVWMVLKYGGVTETPPRSVYKTLYRYGTELLQVVPSGDPRRPVMEQALVQLLVADDGSDESHSNTTATTGFQYPAAHNQVNHALEFYAIRPNFASRHKLTEVLNNIVPSHFSPESTLGLPIRASDKCYRESECLSFDEYMRAADMVWQDHQPTTTKNGDRSTPTIIFTTESIKMIKEQKAYISNNASSRHQFLTNTRDVIPNTGLISEVARNEERFTADENMLSAISSFSFQLLPGVSLGNCCSNFHMLLNDYLSEGLGASSENKFQCMQDMKDPTLRICCGWEQPQCKKRRKEILQNLSATVP